jgi:hypothetical protein
MAGLGAVDLGGHAVQFYRDDGDLAAGVGGYVIAGLEADHDVLVVATRAHQRAFEAELAAAGVNCDAAAGAGSLVWVDATETLRQFWTGDGLDRACFDSVLGALLRQATRGGRPVRIYAEMVALLWGAGQVALALELEELWNELRAALPISLLCGYPARLVANNSSSGSVAVVCQVHTTVFGPVPGSADEPGWADSAVRSFAQAPDAARAARYFVTGVLSAREDQELGRDAAIIVAELAANAVVHAGSGFTVAVSQSADAVRIAVQDAAPLQLADGAPSLAASPGHGLDVVSKIAAAWDVEPLPGGKVIWAELRAAPAGHESRDARA